MLAPGADPALQTIARATSFVFADFANGRPTDLFGMAVRAGPPDFVPANGSASQAFSKSQVLDGLDAFIANYFGPNLLLYATGGGIENTGVTRAINEMLLSSSRVPAGYAPCGAASPGKGCGPWALSLFPSWPLDEPAAFETLLAKGGFLVSAAYDNVTHSVASPVRVVAKFADARCTLVAPWPGDGAPAAVDCGAGAVPVDVAPRGGGAPVLLSFDAPAGAVCAVSRSS